MVDYTDFVRKSTGFANLDRRRARDLGVLNKKGIPPPRAFGRGTACSGTPIFSALGQAGAPRAKASSPSRIRQATRSNPFGGPLTVAGAITEKGTPGLLDSATSDSAPPTRPAMRCSGPRSATPE